MSQSVHIVGFKAPDEKWKKMKKIYDSCAEAGINIPSEVNDFFNFEAPDDAGVEIDLEDAECVEEWNAEMQDGYVVDLKELKKEFPDLTSIRFYNSY